MQIHQIHHSKKQKKRIGRGGKRGTYSGRGQKGQRSRAGRSLPRSVLSVVLKMPKLRGVKNKPRRQKPVIINLHDLNALGIDRVAKQDLVERKIIKTINTPVKILADGEVTKAFFIEGIPVSKKAAEKIKKAGGSIS
jgi:large subunit ribosomal protein L15